MPAHRYVRRFDEIDNDDVPLVGGKNASIGEMYRQLADQGVRVPDGFAVTAAGYRHVLDAAGAWPALREAFEGLHHDDVADLATRAARARGIVHGAGLPDDLAAEVLAGYRRLEEEYGAGVSVAVRSSATAEDLPDASFAGQHDSFLNVSGEADLLEAVRQCFASVFTDRGVHYRHRHGYDQLQVGLSVGVMKMVRSDRAAAGVLFTLDTESGFRDVVFLTSSYGLGENVVKGAVDPDEFYVHKPTFETGHRTVLRRRLGGKAIRMVLDDRGAGSTTRDEDTPDADRARFSLTDTEVLALTGTALAIERHYGRPMDIEWAKDGLDGLIYIVQARPETVTAAASTTVMERFVVESHGPLLSTGRSVGARIATGRARVIRSAEQLADFRPGEVLVSETTTPDWEPVMKTAAAVVTDRGGRTCHAAIIAREQGVPAVVGTGDGSTAIPDGTMVTVSCAEGDAGRVYRDEAAYRVEEIDVGALLRPRTRIMVNLGNPGLAFKTSFLPNDGVGLARMEFVFTESVRVHPMAALHPELVTDATERAAVERLVAGHADGGAYVVERLSEGIATIAAAFHPKPVVVRMSDFKSNEYATLLGGASFEPVEDNPMIGFRGASRYAHPAYAEGFALECRAMKRVRDDMGLTNVVLMIPFVRRLAEADLVLATMAEHGLGRGTNGLEIYAMCEIPNNVILVDEFARRFDGLSIGSNDLTQLTLGVDRDSDLVAFDYDERDPGVKRMIELAVEGCRRNGIHSGLCGQAPSDYPDMAQFLVELGIDSMSLNPDSLVSTTRAVLDLEMRLARADEPVLPAPHPA
ncbi:phosphoenolpyruvate synthase [Nocardioides sp. Soil805]|uniref:phosphoenolpyruvate synthase n=1 Tax=Nocardioides sp. Soil805 TaxID=1736416 RepID=UPI00070297FD|nr:phosphoenolpyruvate synthase [Nocardioides sp. Soil805]KRF34131.1 phosphoenolpyruvate synthase [Nocardioides sp. Soil805]